MRRSKNFLPTAPNGPADLTGKRLNGLDLSGLDLSRVVLRAARLNKANLKGSLLAGADSRSGVDDFRRSSRR